MSVTQQIKDRLDIVQYIQEYVPDLKKAGRYYKACCPFHDEKTPSFVVNPDTQSWRCFGACAEGGDVFTFAQKINGWDFREALRELGQRTGVQLRKRTPEQSAHDAHLEKLRGMLKTAAQYYHQHLLSDDPLAQKVLAYARHKRGFTLETIEDFEIGFAPPGWDNMLGALRKLGYSDDEIVEAGLASRNDQGRVYDRFRNRLMIPIRDGRGRVLGFGARALADEDNPKYLNSPQTPLFDKSQLLFGLDKAQRSIREGKTAVVVEGYMDVIQAHQAGYRNVVAQMGTAMTDRQLQLIAPHATRIILALDADEAGQNATRRSLEVARRALQADYTGSFSVDLRVLQMDGAKDPDDVLRETPDKWSQYVDSARSVADFVIALETQALPPNASLPERQAAARNILPLLTASENHLYRQENVQKLALALRIPENDLLAWARQLQQQEAARQRRQQSRREPPAAPPPDAMPASRQEPPPFLPPEDEGRYDYEEDWIPLPEELPAAAPSPPPTARVQQFTSRSSSRAMEGYCLGILLRDPHVLFQVNRRLRELAGDSDSLQNGPLAELGTEDFSQGDYRVLLATLQEALAQDELEPLDYMLDQVDDSLLEELNRLLVEEVDSVRERVQQRYNAEIEQVWRDFSQHIRPGIDQHADVVRQALKVRHHRLEREQQEIRFLLEEARHNQDSDAEHVFFAQSMPIMQALFRIQQALQPPRTR